MIIKFNSFGGIAPKLKAHQLPEGVSQVAENVRFERSVLESYRGFQDTSAVIPTGTKLLYRYVDIFWMGFPDRKVSVADAHKVLDPDDSLIIADLDFPKITNNQLATAAAPYPTITYRLGVPQPGAPVLQPDVYKPYEDTSAPVEGEEAEEVDAPDPDVDIPVDAAYRFSFVDGFGREGALSPPTGIVTFYEGYDEVTVKLPSAGSYVPGETFTNGAKVRIYRSSTSGDYLFLDEVFYASTEYVDLKMSDELGLPPETEGWYPPPDDDPSINPGGPLRNLTPMPGGFFIGSTGDELCASVPDAPHAWPYEYRVPIGDRITGITASGNSVVVATEGPTFVTQGVSPDSLQPTRINTNQSCVAPASMVNVNGAVIYASPDGLVGVVGYDAQVLTSEIMTKEEWQSNFDPSSIHAYYYEGKYLFFSSKGGWVFAPGKGKNSLSPLSFNADAGYVDLKDDTLYLLIDGVLKKFDSDPNTRIPYDWVSREVRTRNLMNFGYLRVIAEEYPVTVTLHRRTPLGDLKFMDLTVNSYEPVNLPAGFTAKEFWVSATGTSPIEEIAMANSRLEFDDA